MNFSAKNVIEALEARIAPAIIIAGVPNALAGNDVDYTDTDPLQDALFLDTEVEIGDAKIAGKVGPGLVGAADTFYIRLSAGDTLQIYNVVNGPTDFLKVSSGNIIAFFVDKNLDNEVDENELTGISMGKGARFQLFGSIDGDVVANLNELGTKSTADDELDMTGLVSGQQFIGGINVSGGSIGGSIVAGGNISNIDVAGTVSSILAGSAADGKAFDFFPNLAGGDGQISFTPLPGKTGANITNVTVTGVGSLGSTDAFDGLIQAGGGGTGAKGGNVTLVSITQDGTGLRIVGGTGGDGTSGKAGAGGLVSRIYVSGFPDVTMDTVSITGGLGGSSASGVGGAGGALKDIFVGYRLFAGKPFPTDDLLIDNVQLTGGAGGSGKTGGAGGSIFNADIRVKTAEGAGDEIAIIGGAGGSSDLAGGKAGSGGNLFNIVARNQDLAGLALYPDTLLQGGSAGTAVAGSKGGSGGNITNATLLSWQFRIAGGNGSDGRVGGNGGSITNVTIEENDDILAIGAQLDAGFGGSGVAGNGGKGGNINRVLFEDSDLADVIINGGNAADGGSAIGGKGGIGGSVFGVTVRDNNVSNGATQTSLQPFTLRSGNGGDGTKGGGNAGSVKLLTVEGTNMNAQLFSGAGGNVVGAGAVGKGGAGGTFDNVSVTLFDLVSGVRAFGTVVAGNGGIGAGNNGAGGAGGDVRSVTVSAAGSASIQAGHGGDGQVASSTAKGGAVGRGGNIIISQVTAGLDDGFDPAFLPADSAHGALIAGNAGVNGAKAGAGGSVAGLNSEIRAGVFAKNNLLIQAGNGSLGGAGGSLKFLGFGSSTISFNPTPVGDITLRAGDGSAAGKKAGAGGSMQDVSGSLASPDLNQPDVIYSTTITAGIGGGSEGKSAAGGSIRDLIILGGGYAGALLTVQAGDAGDTTAAVGAKGGEVRNVTVSSVDLGTIFRSVAAGDGGDATKKGGAGGNIDGVYADGIDIGSRTDVPYGLTQMGGLFAGLGGEAQIDGLNGKVINIVAKGIGAIVAGRGAAPEAAELVDNIILSGDQSLLRAGNVFIEGGPFRLSYDAFVSAVESTPGTVGSTEVQTLTLGVLQSPAAELVFTYGGQSTVALPGDATAAEVEAALNALSSVQATGPDSSGTVTVTAVAGGFDITFNENGDQVGLITVEATAETALLPVTSTNQDVENALNALPTIQYLGTDGSGGSVDVTGSNGSFRVTYQQSGNVVPLEGIEVFDANLTELTKGSTDTTSATEVLPGAIDLDVTEVRTGEQALFVEEQSPGSDSEGEIQIFSVADVIAIPGATVQFGFNADFVLNEVTPGDQITREVQNINLTAVRQDVNSSFTLSFNGFTTGVLPFNATQAQIQQAINAMPSVPQAGGVSATLAANNVLTLTFSQNGPRNEFTGNVVSTSPLIAADAGEVAFEAALNAMAPVRMTAPDRISGAVDVEFIGADAYRVTFLEFGDQDLLNLNGLVREVQVIETDPLIADPAADFTLEFSREYTAIEALKGSISQRERQDIRLGGILGDASSTFTISYNNRTTAPLPGTATATEVRDAINALGIGTVTVVFGSGTNTGNIQITFSAFGDNPLLFTADATSRTAPLDAGATPAEVEAALNALGTIRGPVTASPESVSVADVGGDYEITFSENGQRNMIVASVISQEMQEVDVRSMLNVETGSFRLGFGGQFTGELPADIAPADLEAALNALPAVQAAGTVTVAAGTEVGVYEIRFVERGAQTEFTVYTEVDEVQDIDFAPAKDITLTVNQNFISTEVVQGGPGVQEVQVLTMGAVLGSDAQFTLTYAGETTIPLPGTATAADIQAALNALPSIGVDGVTVVTDAATVQITFTVAADQPPITARASQSTDPLPANSTAAEIEDALNALATVQAVGDNASGGTVSVVVGTGSNFNVRFSSGGDQEFVVGTQEQALQVFTIRQGNTVVQEIQGFSPQAKGQPITAAYSIANIIGFYSDHTEIDANVFHFYHNGVLTDSTERDFLPGDEPIDGLVFAKRMNQARISVTPEAYRVGDTFYDWNNLI